MCVIWDFSCGHPSKIECQDYKTRLITEPDMEVASAIIDVEDDPFVDTNAKPTATNTKAIKGQLPHQGQFSSSPLPPPKFLLSPTKPPVEANPAAANLQDVLCGLSIKEEKVESECHNCILMKAREDTEILEDERAAVEKLQQEVKLQEDVKRGAQHRRKHTTKSGTGNGTGSRTGTGGGGVTGGGIPVWTAERANLPRKPPVGLPGGYNGRGAPTRSSGVIPNMPPTNNMQARTTPHSYPPYMPNVYYDNTTTTTVHQSTGVYQGSSAPAPAPAPMYNPMLSGMGRYHYANQPMQAPQPQHAYAIPILQYGAPVVEAYQQYFNAQMPVLEMEMEMETSVQFQVEVQDVYEQYAREQYPQPQIDAQGFWYLPRM